METDTVVRKSFNNFFTVQNGKALDKGNDRPPQTQPLNGSASFVLITERGGSNTVRSLGPITRSEALGVGKRAAQRSQDPDATFIVGQSMGRLGGQTLYRDVAGFRFKKGR